MDSEAEYTNEELLRDRANIGIGFDPRKVNHEFRSKAETDTQFHDVLNTFQEIDRPEDLVNVLHHVSVSLQDEVGSRLRGRQDNFNGTLSLFEKLHREYDTLLPIAEEVNAAASNGTETDQYTEKNRKLLTAYQVIEQQLYHLAAEAEAAPSERRKELTQELKNVIKKEKKLFAKLGKEFDLTPPEENSEIWRRAGAENYEFIRIQKKDGSVVLGMVYSEQYNQESRVYLEEMDELGRQKSNAEEVMGMIPNSSRFDRTEDGAAVIGQYLRQSEVEGTIQEEVLNPLIEGSVQYKDNVPLPRGKYKVTSQEWRRSDAVPLMRVRETHDTESKDYLYYWEENGNVYREEVNQEGWPVEDADGNPVRELISQVENTEYARDAIDDYYNGKRNENYKVIHDARIPVNDKGQVLPLFNAKDILHLVRRVPQRGGEANYFLYYRGDNGFVYVDEISEDGNELLSSSRVEGQAVSKEEAVNQVGELVSTNFQNSFTSENLHIPTVEEEGITRSWRRDGAQLYHRVSVQPQSQNTEPYNYLIYWDGKNVYSEKVDENGELLPGERQTMLVLNANQSTTELEDAQEIMNAYFKSLEDSSYKVDFTTKPSFAEISEVAKEGLRNSGELFLIDALEKISNADDINEIDTRVKNAGNSFQTALIEYRTNGGGENALNTAADNYFVTLESYNTLVLDRMNEDEDDNPELVRISHRIADLGRLWYSTEDPRVKVNFIRRLEHLVNVKENILEHITGGALSEAKEKRTEAVHERAARREQTIENIIVRDAAVEAAFAQKVAEEEAARQEVLRQQLDAERVANEKARQIADAEDARATAVMRGTSVSGTQRNTPPVASQRAQVTAKSRNAHTHTNPRSRETHGRSEEAEQTSEVASPTTSLGRPEVEYDPNAPWDVQLVNAPHKVVLLRSDSYYYGWVDIKDTMTVVELTNKGEYVRSYNASVDNPSRGKVLSKTVSLANEGGSKGGLGEVVQKDLKNAMNILRQGYANYTEKQKTDTLEEIEEEKAVDGTQAVSVSVRAENLPITTVGGSQVEVVDGKVAEVPNTEDVNVPGRERKKGQTIIGQLDDEGNDFESEIRRRLADRGENGNSGEAEESLNLGTYPGGELWNKDEENVPEKNAQSSDLNEAETYRFVKVTSNDDKTYYVGVWVDESGAPDYAVYDNKKNRVFINPAIPGGTDGDIVDEMIADMSSKLGATNLQEINEKSVFVNLTGYNSSKKE